MFNGNKHDFQGTPTVPSGAQNGETRNSFFYIHPCNGTNDADMPIKVLGTHYHWGTRSVSGLNIHVSICNLSIIIIVYFYDNQELII